MTVNDVNMVLVGDTFVGRPDPDDVFKPVKHLIQGADIAFCNLETVVADSNHIDQYDRDARPRMDESSIAAYMRTGFNFMNQAIIRIPIMGYMPWFVVWKSWKP